MTNEQINVAIAEACGWEVQLSLLQSGLEIVRDGKRKPLPNYCTDLNAMHEAEKVLTPKNWNNFSEKWWDYCDFLTFCCDHDTKQSFHATARQRAEAFLRTLGLWKEARND